MVGRVARAMLPGFGLAVAYALAIIIGRASRVEGSQVSLVWPAAAVAVLWALYARTLSRTAEVSHWVGLVAVTFLANLTTGATVGLSAWFSLVNVALAGVTAGLLTHRGRTPVLREPGDLGRLVAAVAAGTVAAATLATIWFAHAGQHDLPQTFALFAIRNGVTVLAGVAVVMRLRDAQWRLPERSMARTLETVACVAVIVVVFLRVFWVNPGHPNAFGVMLPALWVSLRY
ncbi:MAG TPA: hypothetical protein VGE43_12275, partial [Acidimicrobiales bacterium]